MSVTLFVHLLAVLLLMLFGVVHWCWCTRQDSATRLTVKGSIPKHVIHRHSHDAHATALSTSEQQSHFPVQCAKKKKKLSLLSRFERILLFLRPLLSVLLLQHFIPPPNSSSFNVHLYICFVYFFLFLLLGPLGFYSSAVGSRL